MATMVPEDLLNDINGLVPWIPKNLSLAQIMRWAEGLKWEYRYFNEAPAKFRLEVLREDVREERQTCLIKLYEATRNNPEQIFHQTVVTVDRLLMTRELPPEISMMKAVAACHFSQLVNRRGGEDITKMAECLTHTLKLEVSTKEFLLCATWVEQVLGKFSTIDVHTAADWFKRMTPEGWFAESGIETIFLYLAMEGSLAHCTPSSIAVAVMVKFMGSTKAEPYMHGYFLFDVAALKAEVDCILDRRNLVKALACYI